MILTCPACATRYLLNPAALRPNGRQVRCARCSHEWREPPPKPPAEPAATLEPVAPPRIRPIPPGSNLPALARPRRGPAALGWAALVLAIVALVAGGWYWRNEIVTAWPPAARLYAALQLPVIAAEAPAVELRNLRSSRTVENGAPVLIVAGEVANPTAEPQSIPPIRVGLRDFRQNEIDSWTFRLDAESVPAGGTVSFTSRLVSPPEMARDLEVGFAPPGSVAE